MFAFNSHTAFALHLVWGCIVVSIEGLGLSHIVRNNLRASRGSIMLLDRHAFLGEAFIEGANWLVLFCGDHDAQQCVELRRDLDRFHLREDSALRSMRLAEVNCTRDAHVCHQQGFAAPLVSVVHYYEGSRRSVWLSNGEDPQRDLSRWIRMNFESGGVFSWRSKGICEWTSDVLQHASDWLLLSFPNLRRTEVAVVAVSIVIFQLSLVCWTIMEGLQLWPESQRKAE